MKTNYDGSKDLNVSFDTSSSIDSQFDSSQDSITVSQVETEEEVHVGFESPDTNLNVIFEMTGGKSGEDKILYNTTSYWNSHSDIISKQGYIYIYSDYYDYDGKHIAGLKVGDGSTYLIDLPVLDKMYYDHMNDMIRHITQAEREFWNNKVTCYEIDKHTLVFTKD